MPVTPTDIETKLTLPDFTDGPPNFAMASHQNDVRGILRWLSLRDGGDTRGGGSARGFVHATSPNPTMDVVIAGVFKAKIGARRVTKAPGPFTLTSFSIAGLTTGQKRIDLLTLDTSGTLAWTTGTATTGTPAAPADPTGKLVLAEVYHRQGSTSVKDLDDSVNSYITDARPVLVDALAGSIVFAPLRASFVGGGGGQNDYAPTGHADATIFYLTSTGSDGFLNGLAGGADGRTVYVHNAGGFSITLRNENAGSAATNRFYFGGQDLPLASGAAATLQYDGVAQRWHSAGGGGAANITVREIDGTPSMVAKTIEFSNNSLTDMGGNVARVNVGGVTVREVDAAPSVLADTIEVPNGSLTVIGSVARVAFATGGGGSPGNSPVLIQEQVLTGSQATIDFNGIAQTFKSLKLVIIARYDAAVTHAAMFAQFNGDTGNNYDAHLFQATGATTTSSDSAAQAAGRIGLVTGASAPANAFAETVVTIPNYATAQLKVALCQAGDNTATGVMITELDTMNWRSTAAITSIKIFPNNPASGNFVAGTIARLYGEEGGNQSPPAAQTLGYGRVYTSGAADQLINVDTAVDVTGAVINLTTVQASSRIQVEGLVGILTSNATQYCNLVLTIDGGASTSLVKFGVPASQDHSFPISHVFEGVAPGPHTIKLRAFCQVAASTTFTIRHTTSGVHMTAYELPNSTPNVSPGTGGMAVIFDQTLGSAQASITIPGILPIYKELRVVIQAQSDQGNGQDILVRFNGDTGTNYDSQTVSVTGSSAPANAGARSLGGTSATLGSISGTNNPNAAAVIRVEIPNYAGGTFEKQYVAQGAWRNAAAAVDFYATHSTGNWRSTAAINSITVLHSGAGNFKAGTRVIVYGVDGISTTPAFLGCSVFRSADYTSFPNAVFTVVPFDSEDFDTDNMHYTSASNLTGTAAKTAGSNVLTGTGTAFDTELSVGQVISVPGTAAEKRVVIGIASATSLTVSGNFANTASGQTVARVNSAIVFRTPGIYRIEAAFAWNNSGGTNVGCMMQIFKNGSTAQQLCQITAMGGAWTGNEGASWSRTVSLNQWEFIEMQAYTDNSTTRTLAALGTYLTASKVG